MFQRKLSAVCPVAVCGWLVLFCQPAADAASFEGLGFVLKPVAGWEFLSGCLSADGATIVGTLVPDDEAVRWTRATGLVRLGTLPGTSESEPFAVSADGSVIVGVSGDEAFRWTETTGMVSIGSAQNLAAGAYGVSADGSVVVGATDLPDGSVQAYRWTEAEGMVILGYLPGFQPDEPGVFSSASGVSSDGSTVVGTSRKDPSGGGTSMAVRWTEAEGMVGLGYVDALSGKSSYALGISADGSSVVGTAYTLHPEGDRWVMQPWRWRDDEGMVGLGFLPDHEDSFAVDASADGSIVIGWADTRDNARLEEFDAWIWTEYRGLRRMRRLEDALSDDYDVDVGNWRLAAPFGISDDGQVIVGIGINPAGQREVWRFAVPEPGTLAVLLTAGLAAAAYTLRRRKRRG